MLAMEAIICEFIGQSDSEKARAFLLHFVKKENNQYSYQNCFVAVEASQIIAAVNIYNGSKLAQLRAPIIQYIKTQFQKDFFPEDETQPGEFYIDSFGVSPHHQDKSIGVKFLHFLINYYVIQNNHTDGLLEDEDNPNAKRLYLQNDFKPIGKIMLIGRLMLHLQVNQDTFQDSKYDVWIPVNLASLSQYLHRDQISLRFKKLTIQRFYSIFIY